MALWRRTDRRGRSTVAATRNSTTGNFARPIADVLRVVGSSCETQYVALQGRHSTTVESRPIPTLGKTACKIERPFVSCGDGKGSPHARPDPRSRTHARQPRRARGSQHRRARARYGDVEE